jgi:hypothetical protein
VFAEAKLKVEFAAPKHGWTVVNLSVGDDVYQFSPSHVPYDSFGELLKALLNIIDGVAEAHVRWNDEPVEHKFIFISDGEKVDFKVYEIIKSVIAGKVDEERFSFAGSLHEVLHPFWKGLRDMQSRQSVEELKRDWQWSFPKSEITELTEKLKRLENDPFCDV